MSAFLRQRLRSHDHPSLPRLRPGDSFHTLLAKVAHAVISNERAQEEHKHCCTNGGTPAEMKRKANTQAMPRQGRGERDEDATEII